MCDLENGLIETGLPDETIEQIIVQSFGGELTSPRLRYLWHIVPLNTQLTSEQIARVGDFKLINANGRPIERKHLKGAEYRPAAFVANGLGFEDTDHGWTVDGDLKIPQSETGGFLGLTGERCQTSSVSAAQMKLASLVVQRSQFSTGQRPVEN